MIRDLRNGCRLLRWCAILARHDALFVFDGIDAARPLVLAAPLRTPATPGRPGTAAGPRAAGRRALVHQARPGAGEPVRPAGRADRGRPLRAAGPAAALPVRRGARRHRGRVRQAVGRAVPQLRPGAGRRRLDRAGALRGRPRGTGGRGQGAAARHRARLRRDLDLFFWIGRARRMHIPALRRLRHGRARWRPSPTRWRGDGSPLRGGGGAAELAENFAGRPTFTCRRSTGCAPASAC